jgi:preprotein translocase subunit SecA
MKKIVVINNELNNTDLITKENTYLYKLTNNYREKIKIEKIKQFIRKTKKISRNSLCECGSGKKFKNCCGKN